MKSFAAVAAFAAFLAGPASAILDLGTTGLIALGSGAALTQGVLPVVGLGFLLKGGLLALSGEGENLLAGVNGRKKRSVEEEAAAAAASAAFQERADKIFSLLAELEPKRCYSRIVCEMAAERVEMPEREKILDMLKRDVPIESAMYDYATAAAVGAKGAKVSDYDVCELRYSCPLSREEMSNLA